MKSLSKILWLTLGFAITSGIIACSKSSNTSGPAPASCPPGYAVGPDGASCILITVVPGGIPGGTKIGFFAQSSNMNGVFPNGTSSVFTQGAGYINILRDAMGVCDRQKVFGGYNSGLAGCSVWQAGYHDIVIQMDGSSANQVKMIIRASPNVNPFYQYSASIPSFSQAIGCLLGFCVGNNSGVYNPLVLDMTIWNINNNQGFELRPVTSGGPTGSYAWNKPMQLQVLNGKIEDPALNFRLLIDDGHQNMAEAISGTMLRCTTQNCGINGL
jgi:hypothetical protein